jgi:hypothetical protein
VGSLDRILVEAKLFLAVWTTSWTGPILARPLPAFGKATGRLKCDGSRLLVRLPTTNTFEASKLKLRDGTAVTLRVAGADDGPKTRGAFLDLERDTVYTRFFGYRAGVSDAELGLITGADFERLAALLVTIGAGEHEVVIGGASYFVSGPQRRKTFSMGRFPWQCDMRVMWSMCWAQTCWRFGVSEGITNAAHRGREGCYAEPPSYDCYNRSRCCRIVPRATE